MDKEKETYDLYDKVVNTIYLNVNNEYQRTGGIILWDFHPDNPMDWLYFNVAMIASDLNETNIYLDMPFHNFCKLEWKMRKGRKNLYWISPRMKKIIPEEAKTSVYIIVDHVREYCDVTAETFNEINKEYYGGNIWK